MKTTTPTSPASKALTAVLTVALCGTLLLATTIDHGELEDAMRTRQDVEHAQAMARVNNRIDIAARAICRSELGRGYAPGWTVDNQLACLPSFPSPAGDQP